MNFERITRWQPAYDKRDADPAKNYGIHGMTLRFILKGERGATQFVIYTNWHLRHIQDERDGRQRHHFSCHPMPADLGYHSPTALYEGQTGRGDCDLLPDGKCFYDGSTLNAEPVYWRFVAEGEDAVWAELEDYYNARFGVEVPA